MPSKQRLKQRVKVQVPKGYRTVYPVRGHEGYGRNRLIPVVRATDHGNYVELEVHFKLKGTT